MAEQIKVSHTLDDLLIIDVEAEAAKENRSRSNMIAVLLTEAITARHASQGDHASSPEPSLAGESTPDR